MKVDILKFLGFLCGAATSGQEIRRDLIAAANDLASAVLMNAAQASLRLTQALHAPDPGIKLQTIQSLSQNELAAFGHLNGLCARIYAAGNALNHGLTAERWNVNLGALDDAKEAFQTLNAAEWGLQALFAQQLELVAGTDDTAHVDDWIRAKLAWLAQVCTEASAAVVQLSAVI
jgi:hypothetical protein